MEQPARSLALIVKARSCAYALPLVHVIETMRPLPVEPVAGVPSFVRGVSIIRGGPTPVIDLGALFGAPAEQPTRFVTLRMGEGKAALAVDAVLGVRALEPGALQALPPLLHDASSNAVEALGTLDSQLLVVLRAGWTLPAEAWQALAAREPAR